MNNGSNILDLPTDPIGNMNNNNISLTATENVDNSSSPDSTGLSLDQSTINQIVNGLQKASISGATQLSSRDIPMVSNHCIDAEVQPNYIPPINKTNIDYIDNCEKTSDIINNYNKPYSTTSLDNIYNEIQTPLLLSVLYFLFQLPFFKNGLFKYLPILFSNAGNLNIKGFLFTSILFSMFFYLLNKIIFYFNKF
jgi:hypothetical protein